MRRRNKFRFGEIFRVRRWGDLYWSEYGLSHCGTYEDGYYCEHTLREHEAMRRRQDRAATQFANEVAGRLR